MCTIKVVADFEVASDHRPHGLHSTGSQFQRQLVHHKWPGTGQGSARLFADETHKPVFQILLSIGIGDRVAADRARDHSHAHLLDCDITVPPSDPRVSNHGRAPVRSIGIPERRVGPFPLDVVLDVVPVDVEARLVPVAAHANDDAMRLIIGDRRGTTLAKFLLIHKGNMRNLAGIGTQQQTHCVNPHREVDGDGLLTLGAAELDLHFIIAVDDRREWETHGRC